MHRVRDDQYEYAQLVERMEYLGRVVVDVGGGPPAANVESLARQLATYQRAVDELETLKRKREMLDRERA